MAIPAQRRLVFAAVCIAMLAACWERHAETNDDRAYFTVERGRYRVEINGRRFPLVHDPVSFLFGRTYEDTLSMELPRIEGVIEGREIPVGPDKVRYDGQVVIVNGTMTVALYYGDRRPLSWNDEYSLIDKSR